MGTSGHNRDFQSLDETGTGNIFKGLPKGPTAPNLGKFHRAQRFEEEPRRPMGFDGTTDLEVPIGQGLERALGDPSKAPQISTRKEDIQPDSNPAASQMEKSKVNPLSTLYPHTTSPRKRDKIKNIFKKPSNK